MAGWNYADVWEVVAETRPDEDALVQGPRRVSWREFDRRADGVARTLLDAGTAEQDKVALYLHNAPEYLEACFAAWKAGLVPVNTNYRYGEDELAYLWDNADAVAVVFHGAFADCAGAVRERVPRVRTWLWVDDDTGPCPDWATPYDEAASAADGRVVAPWGRSGEHLLMLYTGGTTGMPKGVMWRQQDLFGLLTNTVPTYGAEVDLDAVRDMAGNEGPRHVSACPLMHGTGWLTSLLALSTAGSVIVLEGLTFDAAELLDTIEREAVTMVAIVGDAFAKPILRALDAEPDRWDLSSLFVLTSSGVMWSEEVKQALLAHHPAMMLHDAFSSSEAIGMANSISSAGGTQHTAQFALGENTLVIDDDGNRVDPGSDRIGRVAVGGHTPIGYYKDPEKSAATFIELDGRTYSMPGDYARVEEDGTLTLLGRGSVCINTGGEKVFPEEVEEVLKQHPSVDDAVAVGVPDERFGEAVTAVVEPAEGAEVDESDVIAHVKGRLAHYKAPKRVVTVDTIGRAPNGKVDYQRLREHACQELDVSRG